MTTKINLLPWREKRRKEKQQEFILLLVLAAILGGAVWFLWSSAAQESIADQRTRNSHIEKELKIMESQIKEIRELEARRSDLIERMQVIQDLQGNRPSIVYIFDQLVRTVPDGVWYKEIERNGTSFTIRGIAESNNRISRLMRSLEESAWFEDPNLQTVKALDQNNQSDAESGEANEFQLTVRQSSPRKAEGENSEGGQE
jgi:type IV pilus assembly protein PilN